MFILTYYVDWKFFLPCLLVLTACLFYSLTPHFFHLFEFECVGLKGVDKFTCSINFCFVSVADWVHPSPCLHRGVYHHLGNWSAVFSVFTGKFSLVLTAKSPHLPVPGLDIAFVISPSFVLVIWSIVWMKKVEKTPQEMKELALVTKKIMKVFLAAEC